MNKEEEIVWLEENFTMAGIDDLPKSNNYLVALWSYPQIELCKMLDKFLPVKPSFFGYYPLIQSLDLDMFKVEDYMIKDGMFYYPYTYQYLRFLTLSDCDMHLRKYSGKVYPLFTSYGCPRGCSFCPSTVNTNRKRIVLDLEQIHTMLVRCKYFGYHNIHFTDEDFFFDTQRAYNILHWAYQMGGFNFIALGEVSTVNRFISMYGTKILHDAGVRLIEVGLETADKNLGSDMGKSPVARCIDLAEKCDVPIFWLTMTFYPGETLKTLNTTGEFLSKYGFKMNDLYGRVQTNGTEGGLGQFFQVYHGTKIYETSHLKGHTLNNRPMRLIPSFMPDSFLLDRIHTKRDIKEEDIKWFQLYKLKSIYIEYMMTYLSNRNGWKIAEAIKEDTKDYHLPIEDAAIFYAICARLRII